MAKVIQPPGKFEILAILTGLKGESPLELIEKAGRTSYKSYHKIKPGSDKKFVEMIRKLGHESVLEHSAMTVKFSNVSRGFTHELVRHRIASYTQQSTRYVDKSNFEFIFPPGKKAEEKVRLKLNENKQIDIELKDWIELNEQVYRQLREKGWRPEDARQFLPIGISSEIVITANFREWRHIFKLRCSRYAHWEIRLVMVRLLREVKKRIPIVFDDFKISPDQEYAFLEGSQ